MFTLCEQRVASPLRGPAREEDRPPPRFLLPPDPAIPGIPPLPLPPGVPDPLVLPNLPNLVDHTPWTCWDAGFGPKPNEEWPADENGYHIYKLTSGGAYVGRLIACRKPGGQLVAGAEHWCWAGAAWPSPLTVTFESKGPWDGTPPVSLIVGHGPLRATALAAPPAANGTRFVSEDGKLVMDVNGAHVRYYVHWSRVANGYIGQLPVTFTVGAPVLASPVWWQFP